MMYNTEFRIRAREFVHKHSFKRGSPNMTLHDFKDWIKDEYDKTICLETAIFWLNDLGFSRKNCGHERENVVEHRQEYVQKLQDLYRRC